MIFTIVEKYLTSGSKCHSVRTATRRALNSIKIRNFNNTLLFSNILSDFVIFIYTVLKIMKVHIKGALKRLNYFFLQHSYFVDVNSTLTTCMLINGLLSII